MVSREARRLAISAVILTTLGLSCSPNYFEALSLRKNGNPMKAMSLLNQDYREKENAAVLKQLYLSIGDAAYDLTGEYDKLDAILRVDVVTEKLADLDRRFDSIDKVLGSVEDPFQNNATIETGDDARWEFDRVSEARSAGHQHLKEIESALDEIIVRGNQDLVNRNTDELSSDLSDFAIYMTQEHPVCRAWSTCLFVLQNPSNASTNKEKLASVTQSYSSDLPDAVVTEMGEIQADVEARIAQAQKKYDRARRYEDQSSYTKALEYAGAAAELDADAHSRYQRYCAKLLEGYLFRRDRAWIDSIIALKEAKTIVRDAPGADKELARATKDSVSHFESQARSSRNSLTERLSAITELDRITSLTSKETRARSIETEVVKALPSPRITYDVSRARNDLGSKLYRIVQETVEDHADQFGANSRQVEILDDMSAYSGNSGRTTGRNETFLVKVDVVDFGASVERNIESYEADYVSGERMVRNYKYDEWKEQYDRDCTHGFSDDWAGAVAASLCVALAAAQPPRNVPEPVYSTCRYRVTDHNLYGAAEVRVEIFHVPDGNLYMDNTYRRDVSEVQSEVEYLQGDCAKAGITRRTLKRNPTDHDVEVPLLEEIERDIRSSLEDAMRPTNVVNWLATQFPDQEKYKEYRLGAIYAEGGIEAIYRELGVK